MNDNYHASETLTTNDAGASLSSASQSLSPALITSVIAVIVTLIASLILNMSLLVVDNQSHVQGDDYFWLFLVVLLVILGFSLGFAVWTYFVRPIYLREQSALVPEKWGKVLLSVSQASNSQQRLLMHMMQEVEKQSCEQTARVNEVLDSFLILQNKLSDKDVEIDRLRAGYDVSVYKKFLLRFIRVNNAIESLKNDATDSEDIKSYSFLSRLMEDALDECSVNVYQPETGLDFRDAGPEIGDEPGVIYTENKEDDFKIYRVDSCGYIIEGQGKTEIITPAKVTIFRYSEDQVEKGNG